MGGFLFRGRDFYLTQSGETCRVVSSTASQEGERTYDCSRLGRWRCAKPAYGVFDGRQGIAFRAALPHHHWRTKAQVDTPAAMLGRQIMEASRDDGDAPGARTRRQPGETDDAGLKGEKRVSLLWGEAGIDVRVRLREDDDDPTVAEQGGRVRRGRA